MKRILSCRCGDRKFLPQRYIVAILCMTGIIVGYGQRICINIAITEMTVKNESRSQSCPPRNTSIIKSPKQNMTGGVLNWTNTEQHYVISSFYIGYVIAHVPAGILCDYFGPRYPFLIGLVISTILTSLTPLVSRFSLVLVILLRIIHGVAQGSIYPGISTLYAKWVPLSERAFLGSFSLGANAFGIVLGNFLTGSIAHLVAHWPVGFYVWAGLGVVWCCFFAVWVYSSPSVHPFILDREKDYLDAAIGKNYRGMKVPWKGILTCVPVWAIVIVEIGNGFTVYTLLNAFPKYLHDVLQFELSENAVASSLPFVTQWFSAIGGGIFADYLIIKKGLRILICRKIMSALGMIPTAVCNVLAGYMMCNAELAVLMVTFGIILKGPFYSGSKVNHLELTANFAGIVMALVNGVGAVSGFFSSAIISSVARTNTLEEWHIVFWIMLGIATVTTIFYCCFSSDIRQKWDYPEDEVYLYEKAAADRQAAKEARKARPTEN